LELARQGADVAIVGRTVKPATDGPPGTIHETVSEIEGLGRRALAVKADISIDDDVVRMVEEVTSHFGGVDILVNNASIGTTGDISTTSIEDWDACMAINIRSQFLATKLCVPSMRERGGGAILNMSSYLALQVPDPDDPDPIMRKSTEASGPGITVYSTTKAAIQRFTLGAAADLGRFGISVNCVAPSWTETEGLDWWFPEIDKSSWERPEEWARVIVFLLGCDPKRVTGHIVYSEEAQLILEALAQGREQ
jgi:NAD(P)-dependent dehydrogenase (short-subunit alcohol dehydrogenase family)